MRSLSQIVRQAMMASRTGVAPLALIKIEHPTLPSPLRFVRDYSDLSRTDPVDGAVTYLKGGFELIIPSDAGDKIGVARLIIDNVDVLIDTFQNLVDSPTVTLWMAPSNDPDNAIQIGVFTWRGTNWDESVIEISLEAKNISSSPGHIGRFNPVDFPTLVEPDVT